MTSFSRTGAVVRVLALATCLVMTIIPAVRAQAQPAVSAPSDLLARALAAYEDGRFAEARRLFVQAHTEAPTARTLRGLGVVSYAMGDYVEAAAYLEAALRHPVRPITAELRELVVHLLEETRRHLGRVVFEGVTDDAQIEVDGVRVSLDESAGVYVAPGRHLVRVRGIGTEAIEASIDVEAAASVTVPVPTAEDVAPTTDPEADAAPETERFEPDTSVVAASSLLATRRDARRRRLALGTSIAGAATAVGGGALILVAGLRFRRLVNDCELGCTREAIDARYANDRIRGLSRAGIVTLSLGAVALVASGVVWWTRPRDTVGEDALLIGPDTLAWRRTF